MARGFSLIEVLLSLTLIALIVGTTAPVYRATFLSNELTIAAATTVESFRRAQLLSHAVGSNATWGVYTTTGSVTLFRGSSYATRDTSYDEVTSIPSSITPSGLTEVVFTTFTGLPGSVGTLTFTSPSNETKTITINAKGVVSY